MARRDRDVVSRLAGLSVVGLLVVGVADLLGLVDFFTVWTFLLVFWGLATLFWFVRQALSELA